MEDIVIKGSPSLKEVLGEALYSQMLIDVVKSVQPFIETMITGITQAQFDLLLGHNRDIALLSTQKLSGAEWACKAMFGYLLYLTEHNEKHDPLLFSAFMADFEKNNETWVKEFDANIKEMLERYEKLCTPRSLLQEDSIPSD